MEQDAEHVSLHDEVTTHEGATPINDDAAKHDVPKNDVTKNDGWASDATRNTLAFFAVVVSIISFIVSSGLWAHQQALQKDQVNLSSQSVDTQKTQRDIQKLQYELQQQGFRLEERLVESTGVVFEFPDDVWVEIDNPGQGPKNNSYWGKDKGTATFSGTIPFDEWTGVGVKRYLVAKVWNTGERTAYPNEFGIGTSEKGYTPADEGARSCKNEGDQAFTSDACPEPFRPNEWRLFAVQLTDSYLKRMNEDARQAGIRLCIDTEPYDIQCGTKPDILLPQMEYNVPTGK